MDKHEAEGTSTSINRGRAEHEGSLLQQAWTLWVMPINPQKKRLNISRANLARLTDPTRLTAQIHLLLHRAGTVLPQTLTLWVINKPSRPDRSWPRRSKKEVARIP